MWLYCSLTGSETTSSHISVGNKLKHGSGTLAENKIRMKAFTMIKDVLNTKLDNSLYVILFNCTILSTMLYAKETWATTKKEKQRLVTTQKAMGRSMLEILLHNPRQGNSGSEGNKEHDHRVLKADVPLGWICCKVH